jgi:hypothetical protein
VKINRTVLRRSLGRLAAIVVAALVLCWPAFWNRYPLLFPDTMSYLASGHGITVVLRGGHLPAWAFALERSEVYSIFIYLTHRGTSLWPIVFVQAAITAWVVWLVVRSLCQRSPVAVYVVLVVLLSYFTSIGWYVSDLMPDYLAPLAALCVYLLVFALETLQRWEKIALVLVACLALASHTTHLVLVAGLCVLLALLWLVRWKVMQGRGRALWLIAGIMLFVVALQMAIHKKLYGHASAMGIPPPFLMARVIADGPGKLYLQQHCPTLTWTICSSVGNLPDVEEDFLWKTGGIWSSSDLEQRQRLRNEQMPLALATLREYPHQQIAKSWVSFWDAMITLGPADFWAFPPLTPHGLDFATTGLDKSYARTRQSHSAMPQDFFRKLQLSVIAASLIVALLLLVRGWRRLPGRFIGLAVIIFFIIPANAFIAAVLSGIFARYQGRVAWLLFLLAGLLIWQFWTDHKSATQ